VLQGGVGGQDGVVGLNHSGGHLEHKKGRDHGLGVLLHC
jgi:hypothetical protein